MSVAQKDILNGWKEIAGYVARDIRTVERWEKQRGLPVRRVPGAGRATVYARISELEQWLAGATLEPESGETPVAGSYAEGDSEKLATLPVQPVFVTAPPSFPPELPASWTVAKHPTPIVAPSVAPPAPSLVRIAAAIGFVALAATGLTLFEHHRHTLIGTHTIASNAPAAAVRTSPVAGVEDLYLRGVYFYEQRTPETLNSALASFNQAIKLDPKYAPAFAGLANTYNLMREYSAMPDAEAYAKAKPAAQTAISLDPSNAQAHASLGYIEYFWSMDPKSAEHEFHTALALSPNLAEARHWYGSMLTHEGRYKEALEQLAIAQRLEPGSAATFTSRAMALGLSGHAAEARTMLGDQLSHDAAAQGRNSITAHVVLALIDMAQPRDIAQAIAQIRQAAELRGNRDLLAYTNIAEQAFRAGGERAMWQAVLAYQQKAQGDPVGHAYHAAEAQANLGEFDSAFVALNHLADQHAPIMVGISMNPFFDPLHVDPRFAQLRTKLGLPSQN